LSKKSNRQLVIITGSSGAGRTTAINSLEDVGFEVVDNIPLSMIDRLVLDESESRNIALGIDIRTRDFSSNHLKSIVTKYNDINEIKASIIFLECDYQKLISRFNETRRKHPLSGIKSLSHALRDEIKLLDPVKIYADVVIDTTDYSPNELREELLRNVPVNLLDQFIISIQSFSYKRGLPRNLDMVFDCRFLKNPYWKRNLRDLDGNSELVKDYVIGLPEFTTFLKKVLSMLEFLIPSFKKEGKSQLSLGIGCTGGKHRSVVFANELAKFLESIDKIVSVNHRDVNFEKNK